MTQDQFEKAAKLLEELKSLKTARDTIKAQINIRERQLEYVSPHSSLFDILRKSAGWFVLEANKAKLTVRTDNASPAEFDVDEGFIGTVLLYLDARIEDKTKELSEL